jgi:hypothetical protein
VAIAIAPNGEKRSRPSTNGPQVTAEHYSCAPVDGLVLNQANEPIASVEQTVFEEMGTSRDGHSPN